MRCLHTEYPYRQTLSPTDAARVLKVHKDIAFKVIPFKKKNGRYFISVDFFGRLV